jgi:ATP-dependent Clp protease ATP-binding subunit ClpC
VDEIIVFRRLDENDMLAITKRLLGEVEKRFENLGLRLIVPDDAARRLAAMGQHERSGARPLRRTIRREIVDQAAQLLLEGALRPGTAVTAVCDGDGIALKKG